MNKIITVLTYVLFLFACNTKKVVKEADVIYTCSMDPQVVSDKPGNCPICGMTLTPVKKSSVKNTDDLELSDQQIQLGNIRVDTIGQGSIGSALELTGILAQNAAQTVSVSAKVSGRIEKLHVKTIGDFVTKGAPLYELYSEQLNTAKQEYIAALQRRKQFADQNIIDFDELIRSARTKLQLWGMTDAQIRGLESIKQAPVTTTFYSPESGYVTTLNVTEGGYVGEGSSIVELVDLSTLWAEAQVYTSQMSQVRTGAAATVTVPGENEGIKGRIEFANPEVAADTRINLLRVVIPNPNGRLRPGMSALVRVQTASRNTLTLPTDAVIRQAGSATVWIQSGKNKYQSRMVTTGLESEGTTEITSGLKVGDVVVVSGAYLLHSEYVFKRGADPMAGHNH